MASPNSQARHIFLVSTSLCTMGDLGGIKGVKYELHLLLLWHKVLRPLPPPSTTVPTWTWADFHCTGWHFAVLPTAKWFYPDSSVRHLRGENGCIQQQFASLSLLSRLCPTWSSKNIVASPNSLARHIYIYILICTVAYTILCYTIL